MADKEKILAKIESLLNEMNYEPYTDETFGRIQSLKELISYIDSLQEESASEDLEEAAGIHALQCHSKKASVATLAASKYDFIAGAKWQKEQMMQDAVDAEVGYGKGFVIPLLGCVLDVFGLDYGNKVKLIIIKED